MTGLTHQALIYGSDEEFLEQTVPFVRDGLDAGEHVFAVTTSANIAAMRTTLGGTAAHVDFCDADGWYITPSRTLLEYSRYVDRHGGDRRVRVIGEPVWRGRSAGAAREWTRYESILNEAFAEANAWIICPYDTRTVDERIVELAHATHPEVCAHGCVEASAAFRDPRELSAMLDLDELEEPPPTAVELPLRAGLAALRTFAREHAQAAAFPPERAAEVELAVHEALANAVVHGAGRGTLRAWASTGDVVYEVIDEGAGIDDPLAGHLLPDPETPHRFGLWVARQLADLVEVRSSPRGTCVRMYFARAAAA